MAVRSKARICGRSIGRIAGSNPFEGSDVCLLCLLCAVEVKASAASRSLVQGNLTEWVCIIV